MNAGSIHLSFSLGEPIIGLRTLGTGDVRFLTQGFQQPEAFFTALPVEWLSFTIRAEEKRNRLDWNVVQTGQESHFEVERSLDGTDFEFLSRLEPITRNQASYEWYDVDFPPQILYYRIRQVDFEGAVTRSSIKAIDRSRDGNGQLVQFYPNPTTGLLRWNISVAGQTGPLNWQLFDATGRLLRQHDLTSEATTEINLSELPAGS